MNAGAPSSTDRSTSSNLELELRGKKRKGDDPLPCGALYESSSVRERPRPGYQLPRAKLRLGKGQLSGRTRYATLPEPDLNHALWHSSRW